MILKFPPVNKYGRTSELSENNPSTNSRPKNGPTVLMAWKTLMALAGTGLFIVNSSSESVSLPDGGGDNAMFGPIASGADFRQHAPAHDADGITHAQQLRQIGADENDGLAL